MPALSTSVTLTSSPAQRFTSYAAPHAAMPPPIMRISVLNSTIVRIAESAFTHLCVLPLECLARGDFLRSPGCVLEFFAVMPKRRGEAALDRRKGLARLGEQQLVVEIVARGGLPS